MLVFRRHGEIDVFSLRTEDDQAVQVKEVERLDVMGMNRAIDDASKGEST